MDFSTAILGKKEDLHIHQLGFTTTDKIVFTENVRQLCEANACGTYGKKWVCPPGVGTTEECKAKILAFNDILVFTTLHELEDSFDFEGMMEGKSRHNEICQEVIAYFKEFYPDDILILAAEGCDKCAQCTYPDAPCRFPEETYPSIESYGAEVNRLAKTVGVNYINGSNTVTYFGCICYNKK